MKNKIVSLILLGIISAIVLNLVTAISPITFNFPDTYSGQNISAIIPPPTIYSTATIFQITTDGGISTCRYSETPGKQYNNMENTFDHDLGTIHKKTLIDLTDNSYTYYVKCQNTQGNISGELETIFNVITPVSASITLSKDSPINNGRIEINLKTTKILSETPSLTYSFDGSSYNPIPLSGFGKDWEGQIIIPDTLGETVGSFRFSGKDLEGIQGNEITSGDIFLVDTIKPETITEIQATGYSGFIKLEWRLEEEEIDYYNIYRSKNPNIDYIDLYKKSNEKKFTDTLVEKGQKYYYRVTAVDEAGNEADLSVETSAIALLENTTIQEQGLSIELIGLVDNALANIDLTINQAEEIKNSNKQKNEKEKTLFENLKLETEINSAISELNALKREIEQYKSQTLTQLELDKKLNSAQLKLNTIKKKIPENIIIVDETKTSKVPKKEDIEKVLLELSADITEKAERKRIEKSMQFIKDKEISINSEAYNLEIIYLDGSSKEISLFKETPNHKLEKNENLSLIISIRPEIIQGISEINVKNINYNVLKENTIISFTSDTNEIIYTSQEHENLELIKENILIFLHKKEENSENKITGFATLTSLAGNIPSGVILGIAIIASLIIYWTYLKKIKPESESLKEITQEIEKAQAHLENKNISNAKETYKNISEKYKNLKPKQQTKTHEKITNLHNNITSHYIKEKISSSETIRNPKITKEIQKLYKNLPKKHQENLKNEYEKLKKTI